MSLKIAYINYHNTAPYNYAFKHLLTDKAYHIFDEVPAVCAQLFKDKAVDIALVPVGVLHELNDYEILPDYGIACDGEVRTVCLFSNESIESIETIVLDPHSRTSNALVQVLCREYWNIKPRFIRRDYMQALAQGEARVSIGDKVFQAEGKYAFSYDLGACWKLHTGLPFVFAVWLKNKHLPDDAVNDMLSAFKESIHEPNQWLPDSNHEIAGLRKYLSHHIKFSLDDMMQKSLKVFLNKILAL